VILISLQKDLGNEFGSNAIHAIILFQRESLIFSKENGAVTVQIRNYAMLIVILAFKNRLLRIPNPNIGPLIILKHQGKCLKSHIQNIYLIVIVDIYLICVFMILILANNAPIALIKSYAGMIVILVFKNLLLHILIPTVGPLIMIQLQEMYLEDRLKNIYLNVTVVTNLYPLVIRYPPE